MPAAQQALMCACRRRRGVGVSVGGFTHHCAVVATPASASRAARIPSRQLAAVGVRTIDTSPDWSLMQPTHCPDQCCEQLTSVDPLIVQIGTHTGSLRNNVSPIDVDY